MSTPDPRKVPRREVLAFIALAGAPIPEAIDFDVYGDGSAFGLRFASISAACAWLGVFGDGVLTDPVEREHEATDTRPAWRSLTAYDDGDWRGWRVRIEAHEDVAAPADQLDADTRAKLGQIAGEDTSWSWTAISSPGAGWASEARAPVTDPAPPVDATRAQIAGEATS